MSKKLIEAIADVEKDLVLKEVETIEDVYCGKLCKVLMDGGIEI